MDNDTAIKPGGGLKVSIVGMEEGLPQKPQPRKRLLKLITSRFPRPFSRYTDDEESPWLKLFRRALYFFIASIVLAVIAVVSVHPPLSSLFANHVMQNLPLSPSRLG